MISNKKILLLKSWRSNIFKSFTISEIMQLSKKRTKTWVFNALKELRNYEIIKAERKGNLDLYSLNLTNPLTFHIIQFIETIENLNFPLIKIISEFIEKIKIKNYSLIIFGSYAEGNQKKNSDLDVCFLIENKETEKEIKPYVNEVKLNHPIEIDDHYIQFEDFKEMLTAEDENLGKQIYKKHKIFYNADIYYQLLKEAHKNGFKG